MDMKKRFKGKIILITGAGRGIGRAAALRFAAEGGRMLLVSRTSSELASACKEIYSMGSDCSFIAADVSEEKEIKKVFKKLRAEFGTLDILVNNAGRGSMGKPVIEIDIEDWDKILNTNLRSVFLFSREALKIMIPKKQGKIINIASMAGRKGIAIRGVYSSSKFGVIGLTESMAAEVRDLDININAINPGMVETRTFRHAHPVYNEPDLLMPDDIAKVILFLASEDSKGIKGSIIDVTNGQHLK